MPEPRFPSLEEFWKRLDVRRVEPDLRRSLEERTRREGRGLRRVGDEAIVTAVAARLVPGLVPPKALAAFLDEAFDQRLGRGDDQAGVMPREELIPAGFVALDDAAKQRHGLPFRELPPERQDELLALADRGEIAGPERFDAAVWFKRTREFLLLGYGTDPRGMVQMGFPGPSYQPGHVWLDEGEVRARDRRKLGYLEL